MVESSSHPVSIWPLRFIISSTAPVHHLSHPSLTAQRSHHTSTSHAKRLTRFPPAKVLSPAIVTKRRMIGSQAATSSGMDFVRSALKIPRGRQIEDGMGVARSVFPMLL